MPKNPLESMQRSLRQRLNEHAGARWPALAGIEMRYRAGFAYVDGRLPDGDVLKLCRLRFTAGLHTWGFAIWLASRDGYEETSSPQDSLPEALKNPSTVPVGSTSATQQPGDKPSWINAALH